MAFNIRDKNFRIPEHERVKISKSKQPKGSVHHDKSKIKEYTNDLT